MNIPGIPSKIGKLQNHSPAPLKFLLSGMTGGNGQKAVSRLVKFCLFEYYLFEYTCTYTHTNTCTYEHAHIHTHTFIHKGMI